MHADTELHLCIINGYPQASRTKFERDHVAHPHDLFIDFFQRYTPRAQCDVLFVADLDTPLPASDALAAYHDHDPRVTRQIELCRAIFQAGPPQYGSCWGVQMAAVAAGGKVEANPKGREWGITGELRQTEAGRQSLLLKGKPERFKGFIMHLDEVTRIPEGGTLLVEGDHTHVQALAVTHGKGEYWATQYHPEYNLYEMAQLIDARAGALVKEGFFPSEEAVHDHAAELRQLFDDPINEALRAKLGVGDDILDDGIRQQELRNWVDYLVIPGLVD